MVVTFLAGRYDIALCGFSAPRKGDDMVHGEILWRCRLSAIMAFAFGASSFPPLGLAQIPGLVFFSFKV